MRIKILEYIKGKRSGKLTSETLKSDENISQSLDIGTEYCRWYWESDIWKTTTYCGVPALKSVSDMWNYQEILFQLQPSVIIEFGVNRGGSTLFFSDLMKKTNPNGVIISVDVEDYRYDEVKQCDNVVFIKDYSTSAETIRRIELIVDKHPGKIFAILDSDHSKENVLNEMISLRSVLKQGDFLLVEDGIVNGNPILEDFGEGPVEAIRKYHQLYPNDYIRDIDRESKFGFTFAPEGFLRRI